MYIVVSTLTSHPTPCTHSGTDAIFCSCVVFVANLMTASWMSRVLKKRSRAGSGSGHESKSDDLSQGINDFSELAAVFDFYEVRNRTGEAR